MKQELQSYQQKSQEDIYLIKGKMQEKDEEILQIRKNSFHCMTIDNFAALNDKLSMLMDEIEVLKKKEIEFFF